MEKWEEVRDLTIDMLKDCKTEDRLEAVFKILKILIDQTFRF